MNFLVVISDQMRYDALQCNGNPYVETPNLNRLAERSVKFTNAFTSAPICSPARHSLISGKYPHAHGVINNGVDPRLPLTDIAHMLNDVNYRSAQINAVPYKKNPDLGFETVLTPELETLVSEQDKEAIKWEHSDEIRRRSAGVSTRPKELHKGYLTAEGAVEWLEKAAAGNSPFHFWVGFHEPHPPFFPPRENFERFDQSKFALPDVVPDDAPPPHPNFAKRQKEWKDMTAEQKRIMYAGYYGLVEMADEFVGKVLDALDRLGLADETMIVFTADHGEQLGDHHMYLKFVMREPSVHIPLMIAHPKLQPCWRHELVSHVDLFPTFCDYAGAAIPSGLHGYSLRPLLESGGATVEWPRKDVISQIKDNVMIRTADWKLNVYDGELGELYHISEDQREHNNLIHSPEHADVAQQLYRTMQERLAEQ
jgi:arylsulfatase A-like enzyme